jgi:hypothetical protein
MTLFGRKDPAPHAAEARTPDEQAIARYRYMLKTAPPETIEQAHAEAFAQLTPEQHRLLLQRMAETVPASERALIEQSGATPQALARLATRAEIKQPGAAERMFGQAGSSLGGIMAGSLLSSIAGAVIGSMIAREFFSGADHGAAGSQGAAEPEQDPGSGDADQAMGEGDSFDTNGFDSFDT